MASDETTDGLAGLAALHARIAPRFARAEPRRRALAYLAALLSPLPRKTAWRVAAHAGEAAPDGMQRLLDGAAWDEDGVRDDLRAYVLGHLGDPAAVLLVGDLGFAKKGHKSVGVLRQYSPTTGRVENCQIGVFLAYAAPRGCALIDRELYLPRVWAEHRDWSAAAGVPPEVGYAARPQLARRMLVRALAAGVAAAWVAGDATYGGDAELRRWLEGRRQGYVLAVQAGEEVRLPGEARPMPARADELATSLESSRWQWLPAGTDAQRAEHEWARVELAAEAGAGWGRWLLARRDPAGRLQPAYFLGYASGSTSLEEFVAVAGQRAALDDCFAAATAELGLEDYEVRHWRGWYRHVTLAMLAHAYRTVSRLPRAERAEGP